MSRFYRKNQEDASAVMVSTGNKQEWMREPAESRVRPLKELFPEPKSHRLQPISRNIGRPQRQAVQTPCVSCNCKGQANQIAPNQEDNSKQTLNQVKTESQVEGGINPKPVPKKRYGPKNE